MGNTHTSTAGAGGAETSRKQREKKQRQLQEQQQQQQQQRKNGVLIPPAFVTNGIAAPFGGGDGDDGKNGSSSSSSSIQALAARQQHEAVLEPSLVDWLLQTSTGCIMLTEYMRPGLYCRIPTGGGAGSGGGKGGSGSNGQFLLALDLSKVSSTNPPSQPPPPPPTNNALGSSTGGYNLPPPPPPSGIDGGGCAGSSFLSLSHSLTSSIFDSTRPGLLDLRLFVPMPTTSLSTSSSGSRSSMSRPSLLVSTKAIPRTTLTAQLEASTTTTTTTDASSGNVSNSWVNVTTRLLPLGKLLPKGMPGLVDDMVVGAWVNASSLQKIVAVVTGGSASGGGSDGNSKKIASASPSDNTHIHLQAAAASSTMDAVVGIQAKIPLFDAPTSSKGSGGSSSSSSNNISNGRYIPETVDALVSWNLNGGGGRRGDITISNMSPTPPPLWLTLTHRHVQEGTVDAVDSSASLPSSSWTLNLSQVFTYDRVNLNVLDDRDIPWVRNHLGWVVQVDSHNSWAAGATWQLNRAVALKAVLEQKQQQQPQTSSTHLNTAVILKRWKQPRMVLSVLNRFDLQSGRGKFVGLGLEVETLAALGGTAYASTTNVPSGDSVPPPPPTKIQVRNATTKRVQTRFLDVKS